MASFASLRRRGVVGIIGAVSDRGNPPSRALCGALILAQGVHTSIIRIPARAEGAYEVRIGRGLLGGILSELRRDWPGNRVFVVTDANVAGAGHLAALLGTADCRLPIADFNPQFAARSPQLGVFVIEPPGEGAKTLLTVGTIVGQMERERYGRDTLVVALGGGVVGDVAGFAAAIFKRGVPCVQVPTTTLALADSAIGGKVGVDGELSKNAYGVFAHPARVYMDCDTARTLDERHYRAGLVESVKHAMIADAGYFDQLERGLDLLLRRDADALIDITRRNVAVKGGVVFRDPEEANERRVLNFGHTIGHAVEAASGYALHHGEAVAIGMIGACLIAEKLGVADRGVLPRARALLGRLGMPTRLPREVGDEQLLDLMTRDKKARGGSPRFVLLEAIGRVHCPQGQYAAEVPAEAVCAALKDLR